MSQERHVKSVAAQGGLARAANLSSAERSEIASAAAAARWGTVRQKATHQGELVIGDLTLPCFVLQTGQRILSQKGMIRSLGMKTGSNPRLGGNRLANFAAGRRIRPFVSERLQAAIENPIRFQMPNGGIAFGYDAQMLIDVCEAVLGLRRNGALQKQQEHIASRCEILLSGFSRVGIVALVDEATGYQADRTRDALAKILEQFIAKELRRWVRTFPTEYYKEMFRLRGWQFGPTISHEKPPLVGKLTNSIVYSRLAPGVLQELKRITPRDDRGRLKQHFHRRLSEEVGHPRLREHLAAVIALMRISSNWGTFIKTLDRAFPRFGQNYQLSLDENGFSEGPT